MSFWEILWFILISFALAAGLMVLYRIVTDLFRDPDVSGFAKAAWIIALIFVPILGSITYLVIRGQGMAERQYRSPAQLRAMAAQDQQTAWSASSAASRTLPSSDYEGFKRPLM